MENNVKIAVDAINNNKVIASQTDTVFGLFANPFNRDVVKKIFNIKERDYDKQLLLNTNSVDKVKKFVVWNDVAEKIANNFWPGGISIILKLNEEGLKFNKLIKGNGKVGFRIPNDKNLLEFLSNFDFPLTSTSANKAGKEVCKNEKEIRNIFNKEEVPVILDYKNKESKLASTVIDLSNENDIKILRSGVVKKEEIESCLNLKIKD